MVPKFFFGFLCLGNLLVIQGQMIYSSCQEAFEKACDPVTGSYFIKVHTDDGYVQLECSQQMSNLSTDCPGGGWTPVLKINGSSNTFEYGSTYWTDRETIHPETWINFNHHLNSSYDIKLPTYWSTPLKQICIRVPSLPSILIQIPSRASSLESLIRDGQTRLTNTSAATWKRLAPDFTTTLLGTTGCSGLAGFNVGDQNFIRARFGIVTAQDQARCGGRKEGIGVGLEKDFSTHLAGGYVSSGFKVPELFSIYVRESGMEEGGGADDGGGGGGSRGDDGVVGGGGDVGDDGGGDKGVGEGKGAGGGKGASN